MMYARCASNNRLHVVCAKLGANDGAHAHSFYTAVRKWVERMIPCDGMHSPANFILTRVTDTSGIYLGAGTRASNVFYETYGYAVSLFLS